MRRARANDAPRPAATRRRARRRHPTARRARSAAASRSSSAVREPLGAHGELGVFARLRRGLFDLCQLFAQVRRLGGARVAVGGERRQLTLDRAPAVECLAIRLSRRRDLVAAEAVERVALRDRGAQPQLIRLAVHHHELVGEVGENARGSRTPADCRAAAALARYRPADEELRRAVAERFDRRRPLRAPARRQARSRARSTRRRPTPARRPSARRPSRRAARAAARAP